MKVFFDVEVLAVVEKGFTDKEGLEVSYKEAYFLNETDEGVRTVLKFNSKLSDLSSFESKSAIIEVDVDESGRNKPRLVGIKEVE